ncbi:MAG: transketolase [Candidatus Brockarchaeota archaeon]|nr:transketolase [Candidatus Brockarchaeota archaeon]
MSKAKRSRGLDEEDLKKLPELAKIARGAILKMTTLAGSGHPGGSMSSIDIYLTLLFFAKIDPSNPYWEDRDRIVISHGHTSPAVYSALALRGFFSIEDVIASFRHHYSIFEGHVERHVPGVEWSTGNLGQGLSAGVGFALAAKLLKRDFHVFVAMSDAEQAKGQVSESRRFARKYNLSNITVIIDYNDRQISGKASEVMPVNIRGNYLADGWRVIETDGHDFNALSNALKEAVEDDEPTSIIAKTIMGKGVSFMEGKEKYHGAPLKLDEYKKAMEELNMVDDLEKYRARRSELKPMNINELPKPKLRINPGTPRTYGIDAKVDNRTAAGNALVDIAEASQGEGYSPIAVFDCDLAESVRTLDFWKKFPNNFFEAGVQEHSTVTIAGALSTNDVLTFLFDFGVFGVDEVFNQQRLNDINHTNLKLVVTHCGLNVGEDGKTHHCIDYVGVLRNLYGFKIIVPADPNQTDRAMRYISQNFGNYAIAVGRAVNPVIKNLNGKPFFGENYVFKYGKADVLREGKDAAIITMGSLAYKAVKAHEMLKEKGYEVMVVNVSCPIDLDAEVIEKAVRTGFVVSYEDHNLNTGLGCSLAIFIAERGLKVKFKRIGITNYSPSGPFEELYKLFQLDEASLVETVMQGIKEKS